VTLPARADPVDGVDGVDDVDGTGGAVGRGGADRAAGPSTASSFAAIAANAALTRIRVAGGLLDRQLASQAAAFEREGGFTERLYRVRRSRRRGPDDER